MDESELNARVKEALDRTVIMALSTSGEDGSWVCPVHFEYNEKLELFFNSMANTKHVKNILKDPRVSVAIFSYPGPEGGNLGLQIKGIAKPESINDSSVKSYKIKIIPEEVWCFDSRFKRERIRVNLTELKLN